MMYNISEVNYTVHNVTRKPAASCYVEDWQLDPVRDMKFYSLAFIMPLGLALNVIVGCVFIRQRLRRTTPGHYFFAMACSDNLFLLGELLLWFNSWDSGGYRLFKFMETSTPACNWVHFLRYIGRIWSAWLVVAITVERFITVAFPLRSARWATPAKAKIVILTQLIISAGLSSPAFFAVRSREYNGELRCILATAFQKFYKKWYLIVIVAGELVTPSIIVIIFTALIIWKLRRAQLSRSKSCEGQTAKRKRSRENQPTMALLAIAITFILMRLPYIILYNVNAYKKSCTIGKWHSYYIYAAYSASFVLAVAYYCINFFLYYASGSTFREELYKLSKCDNSSRHRTGSPYTVASRLSPLSMRKISAKQHTVSKTNESGSDKDVNTHLLKNNIRHYTEKSFVNGSP